MEQAWTALVTGGLALGGVWLGYWMRAKTAREERKAVYLQGHNDRLAEALGGLLLTMSALKPDSLAMNLPGSSSRDRFSVAFEESETYIRQLSVATASHPSKHVREAVNRVLVDLNRTIGDVGYMLLLIDQGEAEEARGAQRTKAVNSWDAANTALERAIGLLHEVPS